MALTLLQLADQVTGELGVQQPSTVISNTTLYVIQLLNLANGLGQNLSRDYDWQGFDKEYRFTTVYYQYTCTTTSGSTTISAMSSTTGLTTNPTYFQVTGTGINQDTYLVSVNAGASTAVLTQAATATGTTTLTFAQTLYAMPSDYDRLIDKTDWSKTQHWEMLGPETAQEWQWLKSGYISSGPRIRYRVLGGFFQIWPPQSSNLYLGFEYMSNQWVTGASGTARSSFTIDTDVCTFPDSLMVTGLKARWAQAKQDKSFPLYMQDYMRELSIAKANDGGSKTLNLAPRFTSVLIGFGNIPDSGYGT